MEQHLIDTEVLEDMQWIMFRFAAKKPLNKTHALMLIEDVTGTLSEDGKQKWTARLSHIFQSHHPGIESKFARAIDLDETALAESNVMRYFQMRTVGVFLSYCYCLVRTAELNYVEASPAFARHNNFKKPERTPIEVAVGVLDSITLNVSDIWCIQSDGSIDTLSKQVRAMIFSNAFISALPVHISYSIHIYLLH